MNRSGPKIGPWETLHESFPDSKKDLFKFTLNFLFDIYDLNQRMTSLENRKNPILFRKISGLIGSEINEYHTSIETGFKTNCNFIL